MQTDPKKPPKDDPTEPVPIVPDIENGRKSAKKIEEKGEPFDSNFA